MSNEKPKLAVVPGGTGGIGSQVVNMFVDNGIRVLVPSSGRGGNELSENDYIDIVECDYYQDSQVKELAKRTKAPMALVYCAGAFTGHKKISNFRDDEVVEKFESNIRGLWNFLRYFVPMMRNKERSNIIGISSLAAQHKKPYLGLSSWAKIGTEVILQTLDNEESLNGIRANVIVPSIIDTPKERRIFPNDNQEYWMEDKSVADIVEFLCFNSASEYVHGSKIKCYKPNPQKLKGREDSLKKRGVEIE